MRFNFNTQDPSLLTVGDLSCGDLFVRDSGARSANKVKPISERAVYMVTNVARFGTQGERIACVSLRSGHTCYIPPNILALQLEGELTLELM